MIPITNKGVVVAECYDTREEALDKRGRMDYTVATVLIDERMLYCLLRDDTTFKQVMKNVPGACYAFVQKEKK